VLLALLRMSLGTGEMLDSRQLETCDWTRLEALAAYHVVTPIVYRALEGRADGVPRRILRRMRIEYHVNVLRNRVIDGLVADLGRGVSAASVPCILLKGAALLRTVYPDPGLRRLGDIDVLVDERDLPRAASVLEEMGFRRVARPLRAHWPTCDFHVVYHRTRLAFPVELHWSLFPDLLPYVFDLHEVRARAIPVAALPTGIFTMSPEHELAYLCIHLERHALVYRSLIERADWLELLFMARGLTRLLWLYDVALYVQRQGEMLDWDRVVADARRWAIEARLRVILELCDRTLQVQAPREVMRALDGQRPGLVERTAHRAIIVLSLASERVGRRRAPPRRLLAWLDFLADRAAGWSHMWTSLFPPAGYLAARYPGREPTIRVRIHHLEVMVPHVWGAISRRLRRRGRSPSKRAARRHDEL
jgi:hypothetical protein